MEYTCSHSLTAGRDLENSEKWKHKIKKNFSLYMFADTYIQQSSVWSLALPVAGYPCTSLRPSPSPAPSVIHPAGRVSPYIDIQFTPMEVRCKQGVRMLHVKIYSTFSRLSFPAGGALNIYKTSYKIVRQLYVAVRSRWMMRGCTGGPGSF